MGDRVLPSKRSKAWADPRSVPRSRRFQLAGFLQFARSTHTQERFDRLAQEGFKARGVELVERVADDRDLLKRADIRDFQPGLITQDGCCTFIKRHETKLACQRTAVKRRSRHEESQGDHPFGRGHRMEERKADPGRIRGDDPHDVLVRPLRRGESPAGGRGAGVR